MNKEQATQAANELLALLPQKHLWTIHVDSTFNDRDKDEHEFYIASEHLMICPSKKSNFKYKVDGLGVLASYGDNPAEIIIKHFEDESQRLKKQINQIVEQRELFFPPTNICVEHFPNYFDKDPCIFTDRGWDKLILSICQSVRLKRDGSVGLVGGGRDVPEEGLFDFKFLQIKQKYAQLTVYFKITPKELDWTRYDKESYKKELAAAEGYIQGVIDCMAGRSNSICEITGRPGRYCSIGGWDRILCEEKIKELGAD